MGASNSRENLICSMARVKKKSVVVVGLDNAGKTSLLSWMDSNLLQQQLARDPASERVMIQPTIGLGKCTFSSHQTSWTVWDMSGQGRYRDLWSYYYPHVHGIIWVVDATDVKRIGVVRDEFMKTLQHTSDCPVLLVLTKSDKKKSTTEETSLISSKILQQILKPEATCATREWKIQPCSGLTGSGVDEGFQWLSLKI